MNNEGGGSIYMAVYWQSTVADNNINITHDD